MDPVFAEGRSPLPPSQVSAPVVAVVVAFNSAGDLPACLASLEAQRGRAVEIHVVDNASRDDSVALVRRDHPNVRLTASDRNLGFAAANNRVLESVPAAYFALVNPDTVLAPDAIVACVDYLVANPDVGIAAVRLQNVDGSLQPSCHAFLGLANLLGETVGAHRLLPAIRPLSSLYMPWFAHDRVARVDWIQGAFLVARGEAVRRVGGFDPAFFMYGEEMDWCRRFRDAGWAVVFLPEPAAVHKGGASSAPVAGPMFVENLKGRVRYLRKHRGPIVAAVARAMIAASVLLRWVRNEGVALAFRVAGRALDDSRRRRGAMFRAAASWVLRGLPTDRYEAG